MRTHYSTKGKHYGGGGGSSGTTVSGTVNLDANSDVAKSIKNLEMQVSNVSSSLSQTMGLNNKFSVLSERLDKLEANNVTIFGVNDAAAGSKHVYNTNYVNNLETKLKATYVDDINDPQSSTKIPVVPKIEAIRSIPNITKIPAIFNETDDTNSEADTYSTKFLNEKMFYIPTPIGKPGEKITENFETYTRDYIDATMPVIFDIEDRAEDSTSVYSTKYLNSFTKGMPKVTSTQINDTNGSKNTYSAYYINNLAIPNSIMTNGVDVHKTSKSNVDTSENNVYNTYFVDEWLQRQNIGDRVNNALVVKSYTSTDVSKVLDQGSMTYTRSFGSKSMSWASRMNNNELVQSLIHGDGVIENEYVKIWDAVRSVKESADSEKKIEKCFKPVVMENAYMFYVQTYRDEGFGDMNEYMRQLFEKKSEELVAGGYTIISKSLGDDGYIYNIEGYRHPLLNGGISIVKDKSELHTMNEPIERTVVDEEGNDVQIYEFHIDRMPLMNFGYVDKTKPGDIKFGDIWSVDMVNIYKDLPGSQILRLTMSDLDAESADENDAYMTDYFGKYMISKNGILGEIIGSSSGFDKYGYGLIDICMMNGLGVNIPAVFNHDIHATNGLWVDSWSKEYEIDDYLKNDDGSLKTDRFTELPGIFLKGNVVVEKQWGYDMNKFSCLVPSLFRDNVDVGKPYSLYVDKIRPARDKYLSEGTKDSVKIYGVEGDEPVAEFDKDVVVRGESFKVMDGEVVKMSVGEEVIVRGESFKVMNGEEVVMQVESDVVVRGESFKVMDGEVVKMSVGEEVMFDGGSFKVMNGEKVVMQVENDVVVRGESFKVMDESDTVVFGVENDEEGKKICLGDEFEIGVRDDIADVVFRGGSSGGGTDTGNGGDVGGDGENGDTKWVPLKMNRVEKSVEISDKLTVKGGANINSGLVVGGEIEQTSDRRFKKNVLEISSEEARDFVEKCMPVKYMMEGDDDRTRYGFIAQDVREIKPELVSVHEGEYLNGVKDYLTLNYIDIIGLLMKQVKELNKEVGVLRDRVSDLETEAKHKE